MALSTALALALALAAEDLGQVLEFLVLFPTAGRPVPDDAAAIRDVCGEVRNDAVQTRLR